MKLLAKEWHSLFDKWRASMVHPELIKQIASIEALWVKHTAEYAQLKQQLEEQRTSLVASELRLDEFDVRVARIRRRLRSRQSVRDRAETEREVAELEADLCVSRVRVATLKRRLIELEQRLESTWDIW